MTPETHDNQQAEQKPQKSHTSTVNQTDPAEKNVATHTHTTTTSDKYESAVPSEQDSTVEIDAKRGAIQLKLKDLDDQQNARLAEEARRAQETEQARIAKEAQLKEEARIAKETYEAELKRLQEEARKAELAHNEERTKAATKIQQHYRGHFARQEFKKLKHATTLTQTLTPRLAPKIDLRNLKSEQAHRTEESRIARAADNDRLVKEQQDREAQARAADNQTEHVSLRNVEIKQLPLPPTFFSYNKKTISGSIIGSVIGLIIGAIPAALILTGVLLLPVTFGGSAALIGIGAALIVGGGFLGGTVGAIFGSQQDKHSRRPDNGTTSVTNNTYRDRLSSLQCDKNGNGSTPEPDPQTTTTKKINPVGNSTFPPPIKPPEKIVKGVHKPAKYKKPGII